MKKSSSTSRLSLTAIDSLTASYQADTRQVIHTVLIVRERPWRDPLVAFEPFANEPGSALLHGDGIGDMGRWSYIAASPFHVVSVDATLQTSIDGVPIPGDAFDILKDLLAQFPISSGESPAPFCGGAVGYIGYEMGRAVETLPAARPGATGPAMSVGLYDVIAAFDHKQKRAWIIANGFPEQDTRQRDLRAQHRAQWFMDKIAGASARPIKTSTATWHADQSQSEIEASINRAIAYIRAGDIFQANITQRYRAAKPKDVSAWDVFRQLRTAVPSPFGAYIAATPDFQVLSASPERFLHVDTQGRVETRPIKGTRPRNDAPEVDADLATALKASVKDRAENLMIVDLMRNDISRVCEPSSVSVPQLCEVETFARVHHLVSVVTGQLRPGVTCSDLLRACFPGGSVTGAPKIRAMEIIHELEPAGRGPYCGAITWMGFDGAMDSSIVIRSLVVDGDEIIAQAGGGIVADSVPALEYEEAMVKLRPLLSVFESASVETTASS
ncbi:MAG: aminodeoxychorismate synthase component I [Rhodospirillaceae bacterium]